MIVAVDTSNLLQAAEIHSLSWKDSHRSFCEPDFVELHSTERQAEYIREKLNGGSRFNILVEKEPVGVVSVTESLIEDLYILPEKQNLGYGTKLLKFAIEQCAGTPILWILENNTDAQRLYHRMGFIESGRANEITDELDEIELILQQ